MNEWSENMEKTQGNEKSEPKGNFFYTVKEVSKEIQVSRAYVEWLIHSGALKARRTLVSNQWELVVTREALEQYIAQRDGKPEASANKPAS